MEAAPEGFLTASDENTVPGDSEKIDDSESGQEEQDTVSQASQVASEYIEDVSPPPSPLLKAESGTFDGSAELEQEPEITLPPPTSTNTTTPPAPLISSESPSTPTKPRGRPATLHRQRSRSRSTSSTRTVRKHKLGPLDDDDAEEMADDPRIQRYAEMNDGLQWGMGTLAYMKCFEPFPEPKREE